MARFRLKGKHYLKVPGIEWEQVETNQTTGKQARKRYTVPMYFDPDDPSCHNYPGEIIVTTTETREHPRDIVFEGLPTPDMEPLDEEADALVESVRAQWKHPIESLSSTFGDGILADFQRQVAELQSRVGAKPNDIVAQMQKQIEALSAQVAELSKDKQPETKAEGARRV